MIGHTNWLMTLTLLPNGLIASGAADNKIMIWNVSISYPIYVLGPINLVRVLLVAQNKYLVSVAQDLTIRFWSLGSFSNVQSWTASTINILALAFDPDLNLLASADANYVIRVWDSSLWDSISGKILKLFLSFLLNCPHYYFIHQKPIFVRKSSSCSC